MKKFKPMKVKNSSIRLPDEFLDHLLVNDGDHLVLIEDENGKFYIRKTRETSFDEEEPEKVKSGSQTPPKTFDEIMKEAQKQFGGVEGVIPEDIMKSLQETLKDPEMMKKIQDMTFGFLKGFSQSPPPPSKPNPDQKSNKKENMKQDDDKDDESSDEGFKINIE
jgi:antitoxin component of MazEF toxin-antitoxin module